jgi:integrase
LATISKRTTKDGKVRFCAQVRLKGHSHETATFETKTEAKRWAQTTEVSIREGRYFPQKKARSKTLEELLDQYIREGLPGLAKSDRRNRLRQLKWWREQLGCYALADVTPPRVAECLGRLAGGNAPGGEPVGPATRNRYKAALSAVFKWAMQPERAWIENNPARRVSKLTEPSGVVRFLSDEERHRLLAAAKASPDDRIYPLVILALTTGARAGELMRLKWSDLDLTNGRVYIQVTKNGDPKVSPILGSALEALQELRRSCIPIVGVPHVFALPGSACGQNGPAFPRTSWEQIREAAGLTDFRFHDLRHTTGSYLAMSGASEREIMEVLGHKTAAMVRRYSHLAHEHVAGVVQRMADKFLVTS